MFGKIMALKKKKKAYGKTSLEFFNLRSNKNNNPKFPLASPLRISPSFVDLNFWVFVSSFQTQIFKINCFNRNHFITVKNMI